jgi:hypothetical protein
MEKELESLWRIVDDPSSTAAQVWEAWTRIREIMAEAADA